MSSNNTAYPYTRGDGVPVAYPLFQEEGSGAIPTSPLQLHFTKIPVELACSLNRHWHSRLPKIHSSNVYRNSRYVCYAAIFGNAYFATAIWSDPVAANRMADGKTALELRRFAISNEAPKNTASRMGGWMVRDIRRRWSELTKLVSYQDAETHAGTIYRAMGWVPITNVPLIDWTTGKRKRSALQSDAPKIRWEKTL